MTIRTALCLLVCLLATHPAQENAAGLRVPIKFIEGAVFARADLRANGQLVPCHVLISFESEVAFRLHGRSAGVLELEAGDEVAIELAGQAFGSFLPEVSRLRRLEGMTADHAQALEEVPVVAILGWPAFAERRIRLDIARGQLEFLAPLLEEEGMAEHIPPSGPGAALPVGATATVRMEARPNRLRLAGWLGRDQSISVSLATTTLDTIITSGLVSRRSRSGDQGYLTVGGFDPLKYAAPRSGNAAGADLQLATGVLRHFVLTLDPKAQRATFEAGEEAPDLSADEAFIAAIASADDAALEKLLEEQPDHRLAREAATVFLQMRFQEPLATSERITVAIRARAKTERPDRRARMLLDLASNLQANAPLIWKGVRGPLLEEALEASSKDSDQEAVHKIRSEIGGIYLEAGDLDTAWRHLLGAAFGLPRDGMVNLRLGQLYEKQGRFERAWSRFLQAAITAEAGPDGIAGLERLAKERGVDTPYDADAMRDALEGRFPAFEPASQYKPESGKEPTRRVLVEVFTGAHCEPCLAADLAGDGVLAHFGSAITLIQHHLPVPRPEPLVSEGAVTRARGLGIRGTPTVVLDGTIPVEDVGGRDMARVEPSFRVLKTAILNRLDVPGVHQLKLDASLDERGRLEATATVTGPEETGLKVRMYAVERAVLFPGASKLVFHTYVHRQDLTHGTVALDPATRSVRRTTTLAGIEEDLDEFLAVTFGDNAFPMLPIRPDARQMGVVAVLENARGEVLQTTLWEAQPRTEEVR